MNQSHPRPPRLTPEAWAAAREDYIAGVSAAVVAERYGATERNIRRRAAMEGWRRRPLPRATLGEPPPWMPRRRTKVEEIERDPTLDEVDEAETISRFGLMFSPDARQMRLFAFRQASEHAAMNQPQQAVAWMRLVQLAERCGGRLDQDSSDFREIDYLRAAYLERLQEAVARGLAETAADPAPAEPAPPT